MAHFLFCKRKVPDKMAKWTFCGDVYFRRKGIKRAANFCFVCVFGRLCNLFGKRMHPFSGKVGMFSGKGRIFSGKRSACF